MTSWGGGVQVLAIQGRRVMRQCPPVSRDGVGLPAAARGFGLVIVACGAGTQFALVSRRATDAARVLRLMKAGQRSGFAAPEAAAASKDT
eukprot:CAMPEP_0179083552 /NCGR_PEP_ID=MMETSP0796-20121207/37736_1 /TAXON_ID=73915 /ORGANISM="Pyrodinium bahamense, Strain pbaha01" /LENGTH=89 /DNA_ID=CAMNT_0020780961 /DNA_START=389 /DNA_END=656 /DNA_ORIENTATION=-